MFALPTMRYEINPIITKALDKLLILHADHNKIVLRTVRIAPLKQVYMHLFLRVLMHCPLHGGANQAVIDMLETIKSDGAAYKMIDKAKDKNDTFRLMGFGHRVYKNFDPRAKIIKKAADDVLNALGVHDPILDIAKSLEEKVLVDSYFVDRKLYPNVDFYSGIIYRALGIPTEMFTVMFALGRLPGWIAQWQEMRGNQEPIGRPRQIYAGEAERNYIPLHERQD